jgi:chromosome segregation ATPase
LRSSLAAQSLKRLRSDAEVPVQQDVNRIVEEQAAVIESLKTDKSKLESSLNSLKSEHDRVLKDNSILRRAVAIQQDRQNLAENEIKVTQQYHMDAQEKIKKLEQLILSLRYHLQTQHPSVGNDFMGHRPPDVY